MKKKNNGKHKPFLHVIVIQSTFNIFLQPLSNAQIIKHCHMFTNWQNHAPFAAVAFIPLLNGKIGYKVINKQVFIQILIVNTVFYLHDNIRLKNK